MGLIFPRNSIAFPATRAAVNSAHPMARGARYAAIAAPGGQFINLLNGAPSVAVNGSLSTKIDPILGPVVVSNTSTVYSSIANSFADSPSSVTFAAILTPIASSPPDIIFSTRASTYLTGIYLFTAGNFGLILNGVGTLASGLPSIAAGVPWFLAVCSTAAKQNWVVANLKTARIWTTTGAVAGSTAVGATPWSVGIATALQQPGASIAAVAYSINNFLSLSQLVAWARNPWDYWYSPMVGQLIASVGKSAKAPIDLTGNLGGVSSYG
jgi:hypothetical protein